MNTSKRVRALVESARMVSLATVLSIIEIIRLPYGGSVTIASMLPMIILAYRHGMVWGIGSGLVYAAMQQLLGLNNLSYAYSSGWKAVVAVVMLDYIIAFTLVGIGGIFKRAVKKQSRALVLGALLVSVLRYTCHVISGATVWAGLSIPDSAALIYSLGYNATYMLPETVILVIVAYYLGSAVDFSKPNPTRFATEEASQENQPLGLLAGLIGLLGVIVDICLIAPCMQNEETGEFYFGGMKNVQWLAVSIVTALAASAVITLILIKKRQKSN